MSVAVAENAGYGDVREGFAFDQTALERWMSVHVRDFNGPLVVKQFKGGQSNPTYRLETPERNYVLRRKPIGALLKGAHAVEREARVLSALSDTRYPVPEVMGLCTDESVIGSWFYVMALVEGRIFWDASLADLAPQDRLACYDSMHAAIADLHRLDPIALGLGDYGKQQDYVGRQIARWTQAYLDDAEAGRNPAMDRLVEWLPANRPEGHEVALVHGDFRIDNMIFDPVQQDYRLPAAQPYARSLRHWVRSRPSCCQPS